MDSPGALLDPQGSRSASGSEARRPTDSARSAGPAGTAVAACPHCGAAVEGAEDVFCCPGCVHAWEIIHGAGLDDYYRRREALPPRPAGASHGWEGVPVETGPDGRARIQLQVDGLRCAACVWVTERVLASVPGVDEAHVSYATGRSRLAWDPDRTDLATLADTIEALGYRPRIVGDAERWDRGLLLRLGFAAFATMNIMLLSASLYAGWASSMDERFVALFTWTALALATPLTFWAGEPFFSGAWSGLKRGVLHMDLPIALAITVLWTHAAVVTATGAGDGYLDSLGMLVTLLLAGRVLEGHGRRRTAEAALSLAAVVPATARRLGPDGSVETVPTEELEAGDRIAVGPGQEIPADGVVESGRGHAMVALITGESRPQEIEVGSEVWAGAVLEDGALEIRVRAAGEGTVVHRMAGQLRDAADRPSEAVLADRLAPWFTGITLVVAAATALGWALAAGAPEAIRASVAVLVVACPCALALAHPLVASAGIGAMARRGLLVRGPDVLARLARIDEVAFDKTGTVTLGAPTILDPDPELLRIAAGLERYSSHPIARSILEAAVEAGIPLPAAEEVVEEAGVGVEGTVDGARWRLRAGGSGRLSVERREDDGWNSLGEIRLADRARDDSAEIVGDLRARGLRTTLLTGDDVETARAVGAGVGVDEVLGRQTPRQKVEWLDERRASGARVLFAGDGLNDGPALTRAEVGVAMGSGATASILAADGVVAVDSLRPVLAGIHIAEHTERAIRTAQLRSIAYNVIAVALAAAGFVNPLVAAILMPLSSSLVLVSASGVERAAKRAV